MHVKKESERLSNMERKLIAIDLDGTTLNDKSQITSETYQTIQKVVQQGHIVSIATGRSYRMSEHLYQQLDLNTPMVNYNGAWCHHPKDPKWEKTYHKKLKREMAFSLLKLRNHSEISLIAAEAYHNVYVDRSRTEYRSDLIPFQLIGANPLPFTQEYLTEDPTSVSVFTTDEHAIPHVEEKIIEQYGKTVEVRTWGGKTPTLEIVSVGIQKAMGVENIANSYGIKRENILAFGDEANDFEMIQYAGHGVAMSNGIDEVKDIAEDITRYTNHENGLAKYLTEYFNL